MKLKRKDVQNSVVKVRMTSILISEVNPGRRQDAKGRTLPDPLISPSALCLLPVFSAESFVAGFAVVIEKPSAVDLGLEK